MFDVLSPKTRRNILRILPFGVIWFAFAQIFLLSDIAAIGDPANIPDEAIKLDLGIYIFASLSTASIGLFVGAIELIYINNQFARRSFTEKVVYKVLFYSTLLLGLVAIVYPIAVSMELNTHLLDERIGERLSDFFFSRPFMGTAIQLGTSLSVSVLYAEISEHMGHGVLMNFFRGKYHTPKEENRIFMFSDMKSSTTIAEELGHNRYFELLRAYYDDLSEGIIMHAGEIYQYVGDEVVVSWPVKEGLKNQNCIASFFAMKRDLRNNAAWYQQQFGLVPDFKAGFHIGTVIAGEIGALKKEIVFTGDVLNATARIQSLCNQYEVDILISGALLKSLNGLVDFAPQALGQVELRGKTQKVELFTLNHSTIKSTTS